MSFVYEVGPAAGLGRFRVGLNGRVSRYSEMRSWDAYGFYTDGESCLQSKVLERHDWSWSDADDYVNGNTSFTGSATAICQSGAGDFTTDSQADAVEGNMLFGFDYLGASNRPFFPSQLIRIYDGSEAQAHNVTMSIDGPREEFFTQPTDERLEGFRNEGYHIDWVDGIDYRLITKFELEMEVSSMNSWARSQDLFSTQLGGTPGTAIKFLAMPPGGHATVPAPETVIYDSMPTPGELAGYHELASIDIPSSETIQSPRNRVVSIPINYSWMPYTAAWGETPDPFYPDGFTGPSRYGLYVIDTYQDINGEHLLLPSPTPNPHSNFIYQVGAALRSVRVICEYINPTYTITEGGWHVGVQGIGPPNWG